MSVRNEAVCFQGDGARLQAVVCHPLDAAAEDPCLLICNAGLIDKAGPQRLHVSLAERCAAAGLRAVRFDWSGIGDSPMHGAPCEPAEQVRREAALVMDQLGERYGHRHFVAIGLCAGAFAAFTMACHDARVQAVGMINPLDLTGAGDAGDWEAAVRSRRVWTRSLWSARAWRNLVTGRVAYGKLIGSLMRPLRRGGRRGGEADEALETVRAGLRSLVARSCALRFFLSAGDASVDNVDRVLADEATLVPRTVFAEADHLLRHPDQRAAALDELTSWCLAQVPEREEIEI